ncbi:unnamed protein product [Adineta steineri]|uniref:Apple domain-containing protein n=1 Tax=Adineta steineri TaxID=433720 RepID=A0A813VW49_9BILA|nr:unnamed protein product [Adineta steineri]CAF0847274.1 unnamed protein product [Adineta steineri]
MRLSVFINIKYQCSNPGCSSSIIVPEPSLRNCQFTCLADAQCRTFTFDENSNQCELFSDIPSQYGNLLAQAGVTTMTTIDDRQLIDCASGNLLWNTTGITVLNSSQLISAAGIYVDLNNTLYVADVNNHVIWKLLSNAVNATIVAGTYQTSGTSSTQLNWPQDVYTDRHGNVYVSDWYNHRVQKYQNGSTIGKTIAGITNTRGSALNQLNLPLMFTFDSTDTYMYIVDHDNERIIRFPTNSTSGVSGTIIAGGNGPNNTNTSLNSPFGVHYLPSVSTDLFITNNDGHSVIRWTPGAPSGVFVAEGDTSTPNVPGSTSTLLYGPVGIKIDSYLNMYVVDRGNNRIQMFCANSQIGITIAGGSSGNGPQQFNQPYGIAFDAKMNMYIGDNQNARVQKFLKL